MWNNKTKTESGINFKELSVEKDVVEDPQMPCDSYGEGLISSDSCP